MTTTSEEPARNARALLSAVLATLALTTSASATVVCNDDGDCWRAFEILLWSYSSARLEEEHAELSRTPNPDSS